MSAIGAMRTAAPCLLVKLASEHLNAQSVSANVTAFFFSDLIAHQTPSYRCRHRCRTANYIQFTENAFNVSLDRAFGDKEFCANLFVRL